MRAKTQDVNKNSFTERPHENEKKRALDYVEKLLEEARLDSTSRSEDIAELTEIQRLLNNKKYGLVWEEHAEKVEEEMKTKIPVFVEDESKKISDNHDSEDYNFLLEGDNLHSLHLLEKTHAGMIDVIYIDPPYNTGKEFIYNDNSVNKVDSFFHSKWLSFMKTRLSIAKNLLKESGVIFISIDDNEQANLKLLLDEVFGEQNFSANFIVIRSEGGGLAKQAVIGHDYLLAYAKNLSQFIPLGKPKDIRGKVEIINGEKYWIETDWLRRQFGKYGTLPYEEILQVKGQDKLNEINLGLEEGRYILIPKKDQHIVGRYRRVADDTSKFYTILKHLNKNGKTDLVQLDLADRFDFPKPVSLIKEMIFGATIKNKNATVLDFFAGSGTTGQAVTELNAEDGGNRKFILATNNENNIAEEVTYERMKRVSAGTEKYKAHPMNLKYFKTAMINKEDENLEKTLLSNVKTLIELQHGVDLSNSKIAVVVNRKEAEELSVTGLSTVYMRGLTHQMLDEELAIKFSDVKIIDIPETYFPLELKEAGF